MAWIQASGENICGPFGCERSCVYIALVETSLLFQLELGGHAIRLRFLGHAIAIFIHRRSCIANLTVVVFAQAVVGGHVSPAAVMLGFWVVPSWQCWVFRWSHLDRVSSKS